MLYSHLQPDLLIKFVSIFTPKYYYYFDFLFLVSKNLVSKNFSLNSSQQPKTFQYHLVGEK